jgi:CheY-like chemotaxis protein
MYQKIFSFKGFEVSTAGNGEEGLKKAREVNPDIILLDIMMPKVNGLEMLKEAKKDDTLKKIPVVVLTNLASDAVINEAFNLGVEGYLVKSELNNDKVVEEVTQYLNK